MEQFGQMRAAFSGSTASVGIGCGNSYVRHDNDQMQSFSMAVVPFFQLFAASVADAGMALQEKGAITAYLGSDG